MSLATGKHLHEYIWKILPINEHVIQMVDDLDTKVKHPEMTKGNPIFEWIPGIPIIYQDDQIK